MCKRLLFAACLLACFLLRARGEESNGRYLTIATLNDNIWYKFGEPKCWKITRMFRDEESRKMERIMVTLGSDSLVAGKNYVKALCQNEAKESIALLLYRQEGDCVYYLNEAKEEVKVLDYNLQNGDTFTSEDGTDWEVVETGFFKDYFSGRYEGSSAPRMYKLQNSEGHEDIWVEGAGSLERGILPISFDGKKDIVVSRLEFCHDVDNLSLQYYCGEKGIPTIVHRNLFSEYGYSYDRVPKTWYTHYITEAGDNTKENVILWVQNRNDTLIGENTYMTMLMGKYEMGNQNLFFQPNPTDTLYYRQEGSRVFMRSLSDGRDILLLDYSLVKGDTFTSDDGTEWRVTATSWDSYTNKKEDYHKIFLCDKDGNEDVWIEGAGSELWGIMPASAVHTSGLVTEPYKSRVRTLFSEEVSFSYSINEEDYKYILYGYRGILSQDQKDDPHGLDVSFQGDTLRIKGKIRWGFGAPCAECEVRGDSIHVILFQPPSYLSLHNVVPSWIDVRIPGFRPGTWHVYGFAAYNGVNHTSDAIEIDTTLTCGNDMGVSLSRQPTPSPSPRRGYVYDLSGRKAPFPASPRGGRSIGAEGLPKGIYIRNGKKIINK